MDPREFPTKGNLMLAKNSLALAHQGYDLMDKKRNILLKELMSLIDEAKDIQEEIDQTFTKAYACLQRANIEHGISKVRELAFTVPIEDSIRIQTRSIMGTEIPHVKYDAKQNDLTYSFSTTRESIDIAREAFREVKDLTIKLSMVENAAYRLATNIKKTQKRANALKNITIPMYSNLVYTISNALEEKEREELQTKNCLIFKKLEKFFLESRLCRKNGTIIKREKGKKGYYMTDNWYLYKYNKDVRKVLQEYPNIYAFADWIDLCFVSENKIILQTIAHEGMCFGSAELFRDI
jgi:V/A-type H+-transporting ATPase subunit D